MALKQSWTRLRRARVWASFLLPFAVAYPVPVNAQIEIAGVSLPDSVKVGDETLALVSCGVRDTLWIDHYIAALYLPPDLPMAEALRNPQEPKMIMLHVLGTALLPERIPEQWREPLRIELREDPLTRVREAYQSLAEGDRVHVTSTARQGMTMSVNGQVVSSLPDQGLIGAMLRAWAEGDRISGKLQRLLLNHPC